MKKISIIAFILSISFGAYAQQKAIHVDDKQFKELIYDYTNNSELKYKGNKPAIIIFYAHWCSQCRTIEPIVEKIAKEYEGKLHVYKVDVDAEAEISKVFGVSGVPMVLFVPLKGKAKKIIGETKEEKYYAAVKELLK